MAARAEAAMVCSCGIRITNAITNVIAADITLSGIHTLTAFEDLSSDGPIPNRWFMTYTTYVNLLYHHRCFGLSIQI